MTRIKYLILILIICPLLSKAQDLTGTWVGHYDNSYVKLVVIQRGDSLRGYTYDKKPGYCEATFLGIYDGRKKNLTGTNVEMLRNSGNHELSTYNLNYVKENGREKLHGTIKSTGPAYLSSIFSTSKIFLRKEKNEVDTIPFMRTFAD